jgi:crossover junction endonuclease MUS81
MKACPLIFQHPSEALQLNGLGPKLCQRLTDKLKDHCAENGLPMPEDPRTGESTANTGEAC